MKKFQVITKQGCPKCETLKSWLKSKKIQFEELAIEDEKVTSKLLIDPKFIQNFCDIEGCTVYTPLIHLDETGIYYFKELFGINGLREQYIKKLLDIK
jgi:hypothetical protein